VQHFTFSVDRSYGHSTIGHVPRRIEGEHNSVRRAPGDRQGMTGSSLAATPVVHANHAGQTIRLIRCQASRGDVRKKFSSFCRKIRRDDERTGCTRSVCVAGWHSTSSAARRFQIRRRSGLQCRPRGLNAAGAPTYAIARRAHFLAPSTPLGRSNLVPQAVRPLRAPPALRQAARAIEYVTDTASPCHWARNVATPI
jgi:hypothetical protein